MSNFRPTVMRAAFLSAKITKHASSKLVKTVVSAVEHKRGFYCLDSRANGIGVEEALKRFGARKSFSTNRKVWLDHDATNHPIKSMVQEAA